MSFFFIFSKNWKFLKMFCKNLCDKVSKMKNLRWPSFSFFLCSSSWCTLFFSVDAFFMEKFVKQNHLFCLFFKKVKTGDFVSQFSRWKMRRPKKQSTPRRSARKNEENSSLRFFIFDTLSQRFLRNIFIDFQFFEKNKNLCFFQKLFAPLRHIRKVFDKSSGVHNDRLRQLEVIVTSRNNIF